MFDGVSFQYPAAPRKVLHDVTLTIRPGEHVALVGANGSGKTTLVKLLCRLYDPTGGAITVDGVDLRDFETTALRREIAVVFQDWAAYHVSARDNIWFGDPRPECDDERIRQAARDVGADEVIARLGNGYETVLGKWFEHGEELSMGEWQKIALARAFVRDTQIVVLDEPTSFLDVQAEHEVFKRFRQLAAGRSTILISHRLSTVRMADRIYVLRGRTDRRERPSRRVDARAVRPMRGSSRRRRSRTDDDARPAERAGRVAAAVLSRHPAHGVAKARPPMLTDVGLGGDPSPGRREWRHLVALPSPETA